MSLILNGGRGDGGCMCTSVLATTQRAHGHGHVVHFTLGSDLAESDTLELFQSIRMIYNRKVTFFARILFILFESSTGCTIFL